MRLREVVARADGALVRVGALPHDPPVLAVATTDLLDPRRYLTGGELVLTGLAWWRPDQPGRSRGFVAALIGAGVAALAAGEAEFGAIPVDLVEACAEAGLPLLRVPLAYSFATITERVSRQLAGGEGVVGMLSRQRALVEAVAAAARDRGPAVLNEVLNEVLAQVERELGVRCWVLSPTGRLLAGPGPGEQPGRKVSTVAVPPAVPRAVAWLLTISDGGDPAGVQPAVVDELVSLVALERELALRRPDPDDALAAALSGSSPAEVAVALRRCGLADGPVVVVSGQGEWAPAVIGEALAGGPDPWALGRSGDEALAVIATADAGPVVDHLTAVVDQLAPGLGPLPLRLGVSDAVAAPALLAAVAEARAVAATGARPHAVAGPDRLASSSLLLAAVPAELRLGYVDRLLGPLIEHDRLHRTDLVGTLRTYLDCSGSWSRCAERMHLHVNTLRYRVERIEALTGRDLRRLEDQVDLLLAVRLRDA